MKRHRQALQRGMTLIELSVVLLILVALAGLVVPYVGGTGQTAMCQATDATMQAVKEAIMGGAAGNGYYADMLGKYPHDKNAGNDYSLRYLFSRDDGIDNDGDNHATAVDTVFDPDDEWSAYNPNTGVGWRGPYLMGGASLDTLDAPNLDASFANVLDGTANPPTGTVHVAHNNTAMPQVFDAWHRPIVLQVPYYDDGSGKAYHPEYARLVSAGPGFGVEPGAAGIDTPLSEFDAASRNDDRVLYLANPDPKSGGNIPCDGL